MAFTMKEKTFNLRLESFNENNHFQSFHIYDHNKNGQLSIMSFINSPLSTSADSDQNGAFVKIGYGGSAKSLFWKI